MLAKVTLSESAARRRLEKFAINDRTTTGMYAEKEYDIPDVCLDDLFNPQLGKKPEGTMTVLQLADKFSLSLPTIRHRLEGAGIKPVARIRNGRQSVYVLTEEVRIAIGNPPPRKPRKKYESPPVMDEEETELVREERIKKTWVGRQGYFLVEGRKLVTGTITHVSMMGCYIGKQLGTMASLHLIK